MANGQPLAVLAKRFEEAAWAAGPRAYMERPRYCNKCQARRNVWFRWEGLLHCAACDLARVLLRLSLHFRRSACPSAPGLEATTCTP